MYLLKEDFRIPEHHVESLLKSLEMLKKFQIPNYDSWESGGGDLSPAGKGDAGGHVLPKEGWSGVDDHFLQDIQKPEHTWRNRNNRSESPEVIDFNSFYREVTSPPPNERDVANDLIDQKQDFKADDAWEHEPNEQQLVGLHLEMPDVRRPSVPQNNANEEDLADFSDDQVSEDKSGKDLAAQKANQIALQMYEDDIVGRERAGDAEAGDLLEGWNDDDDMVARQHVNGVHSDNDPNYARELYANYQNRWEVVIADGDDREVAHHPYSVLSAMHQRQNLAGVRDVNLDVDNMSMEELMELQERMGGDVKIGVSNLERFPSIQIASKADIERFDHRCAICIVDYGLGENVRILPCKHSYHSKCIDAWLDEHSKCPICKMDFNCVEIPESKKDEGPSNGVHGGGSIESCGSVK